MARMNSLKMAAVFVITISVLASAGTASVARQLECSYDYVTHAEVQTISETGNEFGDLEYRFHHEFMGQYVNGIALSLYEWDKDYGNGKGLNYITKPDDLLGWDYYKAMAFAGLSYVKKDANGNPILDSNNEPIRLDTDSFKELIPNEIDRNQIKKIIINESKGNNSSKGTKCD